MDEVAFSASSHLRRDRAYRVNVGHDVNVPVELPLLVRHVFVTEARDAGVNEFLIKPFSVDGLKRRIIATVNNPRDFIEVESYFGPDRRRTEKEFHGVDMRKGKPGEDAR